MLEWRAGHNRPGSNEHFNVEREWHTCWVWWWVFPVLIFRRQQHSDCRLRQTYTIWQYPHSNKTNKQTTVTVAATKSFYFMSMLSTFSLIGFRRPGRIILPQWKCLSGHS